MENTLKEQYFLNIDEMIADNWLNYSKSNDTRHFRKCFDVGSREMDLIAYERCFDSFYEEFGIGKDFERLNEMKLQKIELECNYIESGNAFELNEINLLKAEIEDLMNKQIGITVEEFIIHVENWRGFEIDLKKTTVKKLYTIFKVYEQANKQKK